ncbi:hypothetical protein DPMN_156274 [Dreissena polymorpha]|uniref:Uncharacterized protein n=1 Tax=Dreissena polymorpha TaxID=45954 RepID=A0A9D4J7E9_DREPO|nr:hypothetical protein DPMN_156274 [Dreissena polymorpha]
MMGSAVLQSQQRGSSGIDRRDLPSYRVNRKGLVVTRYGGLSSRRVNRGGLAVSRDGGLSSCRVNRGESSGIERWSLPPYRVNTGSLAVSRDGVCRPTESTEGV